ncbi:MAG TPA: ribonuclease HI family protein [Candidatus Bathyarchaeia archaeon]|nr:ribonuclease HI family protein [Candidatus Bathyarchaeia archaeon]
MIKVLSKLNTKSPSLYIFCDGGARGNPGPAAIAYFVKDSKGKILVENSQFIGQATNNIAEYQAIISALKWLLRNQKTLSLALYTLHLYSDSQLVVNQLNGLFKIKNAKLRELIIQARGLTQQLKTNIFYHHIFRTKNKRADALLNQTLDLFFKKK